MKRFLFMAGLVVMLLMAIVPTASAAVFWCEDDPLVRIITPAGNGVNVHVTNYGEFTDDAKAVRRALKAAEISYEVKSVNGGSGTAVKISVLIPNNDGGRFRTRTVASTGPFASGIILDEAAGTSGRAMTLSFSLDVP